MDKTTWDKLNNPDHYIPEYQYVEPETPKQELTFRELNNLEKNLPEIFGDVPPGKEKAEIIQEDSPLDFGGGSLAIACNSHGSKPTGKHFLVGQEIKVKVENRYVDAVFISEEKAGNKELALVAIGGVGQVYVSMKDIVPADHKNGPLGETILKRDEMDFEKFREYCKHHTMIDNNANTKSPGKRMNHVCGIDEEMHRSCERHDCPAQDWEKNNAV